MDFKMPTSQEQSEELHNKGLESIAGGRLNDLVKNLSLRAKVVRWAAVVASVVGISVSMAMPTEAINRVRCKEEGYFTIYQGQNANPTMCFANAGNVEVFITDVHGFFSGNNAGYIQTNNGRIDFGKYQRFDFTAAIIRDPLTLRRIVIY